VGAFPEALKPYEDIETILPLGRFDNIAAAKVAQRLEKVKPGAKPHYTFRSRRALLEFQRRRPGLTAIDCRHHRRRHYQFNPRPISQTAQDVLSADAVRRILAAHCRLWHSGREAQEARTRIRQVGRRDRRTLRLGHRGCCAAETLETFCNAGHTPSCRRPVRRTRPLLAPPSDLSWERDCAPGFAVAIDSLSQPIELSGGEAVELFVSQDEHSMISAALTPALPFLGHWSMAHRRDPDGVALGGPSAAPRGDHVTFDLSLQHAQQQFVRRPAKSGLKSPLFFPAIVRRKSKVRRLYDPDFVSPTPVPVLRAVARGLAQRGPPRPHRLLVQMDDDCSVARGSFFQPSRFRPARSACLDARWYSGVDLSVAKSRGLPLRVDFIETYSQDRIWKPRWSKSTLRAPSHRREHVQPVRHGQPFRAPEHQPFLFENCRGVSLGARRPRSG